MYIYHWGNHARVPLTTCFKRAVAEEKINQCRMTWSDSSADNYCNNRIFFHGLHVEKLLFGQRITMLKYAKFRAWLYWRWLYAAPLGLTANVCNAFVVFFTTYVSWNSFENQAPDLQMSCIDLTTWHVTRIVAHRWLPIPWAPYQIHKIAGCGCARNAGNVLPATDSKGNRLLAIPVCIAARAVTHVPWCKSGWLNPGGGESVPGIAGACATRNVAYLIKGPKQQLPTPCSLLVFYQRGSQISALTFVEIQTTVSIDSLTLTMLNWFNETWKYVCLC